MIASQFSNEGDVFGRIIFLDLQTIVTQLEQCLSVTSATSISFGFPMEGVEQPRSYFLVFRATGRRTTLGMRLGWRLQKYTRN